MASRRTRLSFKEKSEICELSLQADFDKEKIMDKYGIGKSCLYNTLKQKPQTKVELQVFLRINRNIVKYCTLKNRFIKVNKSSFGSSLEKLYRQNSGKPLNSGKIPVDRGVRY